MIKVIQQEVAVKNSIKNNNRKKLEDYTYAQLADTLANGLMHKKGELIN